MRLEDDQDGFRQRKRFWDDPYQSKLTTTVHSVHGDVVVFTETIAYSAAGGQESDKATVNGMEIIGSSWDKANHVISYTLPSNHGLAVGDQVKMEIDWPRRNRLSRLHFACELVLVLVNRHFAKKNEGEELQPDEIDKAIFKTGAHMSENSARVDFRCAENFNAIIAIILPQFQKLIDENREIIKDFSDPQNEIRFWRIPGLATVPCGGTHMQSTKDVGMVTLKRERAAKGVERVKIALVDSNPSNTAREEIKTESALELKF